MFPLDWLEFEEDEEEGEDEEEDDGEDGGEDGGEDRVEEDSTSTFSSENDSRWFGRGSVKLLLQVVEYES